MASNGSAVPVSLSLFPAVHFVEIPWSFENKYVSLPTRKEPVYDAKE